MIVPSPGADRPACQPRFRTLQADDIPVVTDFVLGLSPFMRRRRFAAMLDDQAIRRHYEAFPFDSARLFGCVLPRLTGLVELYAFDPAWRRVEIVASWDGHGDPDEVVGHLMQLAVFDLAAQRTEEVFVSVHDHDTLLAPYCDAFVVLGADDDFVRYRLE